MSILFTGTGRYIPDKAVSNEAFFNHEFYAPNGERINNPPKEIIEKFQAITGIEERRYAADDQQASDIGLIAAQRALEKAGINPETLDGIILAHNFGNIPHGKVQTDILPSLATRVKHSLGIRNPACTAFDILYGCPGWIQGVILAQQFMLAGNGKRFLVIGAETLSRVLDPYDRDSMIYADGAGAVVMELTDNQDGRGILSAITHTYAHEEAYFLNYGESLKKDHTPGTRYIKMEGRKIYEFALSKVPEAMKACLDKAGLDITAVKKVFIHQANEKMDEGIIKRFYNLYGIRQLPENIMPMSIHLLGNSSVATVPTLFDMVLSGALPGHEVQQGDIVLLASVGAGMNISAITYRM